MKSFPIKLFAIALMIVGAMTTVGKPTDAETKKLLMVSHTEGWHHASIADAEQVMPKLGAENGFDVDIINEADELSQLNAENLENYDALFFAQTTGELPINDQQKEAILNFVREGNGFIGTHSATDTFYEWEGYGELTGAYFSNHPWTEEVTFNVEDSNHPSTEHLADKWTQLEEVYVFDQANPRFNGKHILLSLDMDSVEPVNWGGEDYGDPNADHPNAWCSPYGDGDMWYTALGHHKQTWHDKTFQKHLLGGISSVLDENSVCGSIQSMASTVNTYQGYGEFANKGAVQSLTAHLNTVARFKDKGNMAKAVDHMEKFQSFLNKQHDQQRISDSAYDYLDNEADLLIGQWSGNLD